jgi:RNA ligase
VIRYKDPALVMLAAYDSDGRELTYQEVVDVSTSFGSRAARRYAFSTMAELVSHAAVLPRDDEGFVVRFANGQRLKLKGAEYRRIHALISRCTPLAMWEAMSNGDDMAAIRRDLPEEFWADFDDIVRLLKAAIATIEGRVAEVAATVAHLSDKELGLSLNALPADVRNYVFGFRKSGVITGKFRDTMMRAIRPTGNALEGYMPSYAMGRVLEDATS